MVESIQENVDAIFEDINGIRQTPSKYKKRFDTVGKAFARVKKNKESKELMDFAATFANMEPLEELKLSEGLSAAALDKLEKFRKSGNHHLASDEQEFKERLNDHVESAVMPFEMSDHGGTDQLLERCMISDHDPDRTYRNAIFNGKYRYVGIASGEVNKEECSVVIFAVYVKEKEPEIPVDYGEDEELKQAFDLFDVYKNGKLNGSELKEAFLALGFNTKAFSVWKCIEELEKGNKDGIDFDTFRDVVKGRIGDLSSKKEMRKIFDLFVDDPNQDVIAINSMRRVAKELGDDISSDELKQVLLRAAENGHTINFDEFYSIMVTFKNLNPDDI